MKEKEQKKFYHAPRKENVESILSSHLHPGKLVNKHNTYHNYRETSFGDPNYIYLFNERMTREICRLMYTLPDVAWGFSLEDHALLEVIISDTHPIERDYDQLLHILSDPEKDRLRNSYIKPFLKRFGIDFKGGLSKSNLIRHIDLIPDYVWECCVGSYRTMESIPGTNIQEVGFEHLLKYKNIKQK